MKSLLTLIFFFLVSTLSFAQMANRLDKLEVNDVTAKKLDVVSTTSGSKPCPSMSITQRNEIVSPVEGQCIYNNSVKTLNLYDGSSWVEVAGGGGGGINNWQTSFFYDVGAVVIESDKIYQATTQHTSTVFLSDISNWVELANDVSSSVGVLPMSNGGTDKSLTPLLGGLVYTDDLSMEVLPAGTSGQLLKSNGSAAPEWTTLSVDDASFSGVLSMEKGGTNSPLTATPGSIAYSDIDSLELLLPGTPGQVLQTNGTDAPSFVNQSILGKLGDGSTVVIEELQAPNNQMTQVDTNKHLIESGNKNILQNPSFESLLEGGSIPYWSYGSLSPVQEESSNVIDGKKIAVFSASSEPILLTQSSTLYANAFADGVQGLVSVRVKSDVALKVCSVSAGTTSTSNCVDVVPDNKWGLYKVPTILGATSNGISIASSGNVTGAVYIDDAFVGPQSLTQDTSTCNSIECETEFSASVSAATPSITSQNLIWVSSVAKSGTSSNIKTLTIPTGLFSVMPSCSCTTSATVSSNDLSCVFNRSVSSTTSLQFNTRNNNTFLDLDIDIVCQRSGSDFTNAKRLGNNTTYSSTNADTDWASCGHTPSDFTGFGTVSAIETQCKRQGSDLLMRGNFTAGAVAAVEGRVGLKLNGASLTSAGIYKIASIQIAGRIAVNASTGLFERNVLIEPSVIYMTFGASSASNASLVKVNGNFVGIASTKMSLNARIPIEGWENSNLIIGQFSGLEKCTDSYECTDTFSAQISATGIVIAGSENIDWIDGNCSITGTSGATCTYNTNLVTQPMNCVSTSSSQYHTIITPSTSTGFTSYTYNSSHERAAAEQYIICQKQGADYVSKTAKAVASDQNLRTPGVTKAVVYSAFVSGTTVSNEIGNLFQGGFNGGNPNTGTFTSGIFASTPLCVVGSRSGAQLQNQITAISQTSISVQMTNTNNAASGAGGSFNITCHGQSP